MAADELITLAGELGAALKKRGWILSLAESCTGGGVAQYVTAIAGSSAWFDRGFVCYSNKAKQQMLGVSAATLHAYGAVSEQSAREMALGAVKHSDANVSVAITGIAGPDGGTAQKPVGTVCFAWVANGYRQSVTRRFDGDREQVRRHAVKTALEGLLQLTLNLDL